MASRPASKCLFQRPKSSAPAPALNNTSNHGGADANRNRAKTTIAKASRAESVTATVPDGVEKRGEEEAHDGGVGAHQGGLGGFHVAESFPIGEHSENKKP